MATAARFASQPADTERLPWLADEPQRPAKGSEPPALLPWLAGAAIVVAAASYWVGMRSAEPSDAPAGAPAATVTLPDPVEVAPVVEEPAMPQVTPPPMPTVAVPEPPKAAVKPVRRKILKARDIRPSALAKVTSEQSGKRTTARKIPPAASLKPKPSPTIPWPARVSTGANGRLVRVGTFASSRQAKQGWRKLIQAYPAYTRLPAVVVPVRSLRNGRTYYRLQMGTTSQAHSTVVCQRLRMINTPCVVVLPRGSSQA